MVQSEVIENSNSADEGSAIILPENPAKGICSGKYRLVGWGIDTTGSRLIDEIVQIASYTPSSQFSQYIMPFADMNPLYTRRHGIRIVNSFRYRRLRDLNSGEYLKTKSEISALQDFLQWLEKVKGEDVDGVVLVYYELRKFSPGMFLEALKRYQLLDRFSKIVKGFVNGFNIAKAKCANITKQFSIRIMSKILLNKECDNNYGNAVDRAQASFDITTHLAQSEREDLDGIVANKYNGSESHIIDLVCPFTNPIHAEEEEVAVFKILLERQNTFRPVFGALMRASRQERQHASHLRRLLAENNINYDKLKEAYELGAKQGLETLIKNEIANAKEKDLEELLNILDCFFDPEKKAIQPKKYFSNNFNRRRTKSFNRKKKSSSSESQSPNASTDNQTDPVSETTTPRSDEQEKIAAIQEPVAAQ